MTRYTPQPAITDVPEGDLTPPKAPHKTTILIDLLRRPGGAILAHLMEATGWQAHSIRGAIAGTIKKRLGLNVISEKTDAGRVYRIVDGGAK